MTTITIERSVLEQALANMVRAELLYGQPNQAIQEAIRAALSAPATAPEKTVKEIMEFVRHYAANTFSSATLEDKIRRALVVPATAPAWHVAPTVPGLWLNSVFMKVEDVEQWHIDCQLHLECARWFGPIPPDGDKP